MIEIEYSKTLLKDMKKLQKKNAQVYEEIKTVCFEELPNYEKLSDVPNVKKLTNYSDYYRLRIGSYRVGFKKETIEIEIDVEVKDKKDKIVEKIQLLRALHRKDIFTFFP